MVKNKVGFYDGRFSSFPEDILSAIKQEETRSKSGNLKIFFGMSAGELGKTYAMLKAHNKNKGIVKTW